MSGNSGSANTPSQGMTFNFYQSAPSTIHFYNSPWDHSMVQSQQRAEGRQESTPLWQPQAPSQPPAVVRRSIGPDNGVTSRHSPGSPFPAGPSPSAWQPQAASQPSAVVRRSIGVANRPQVPFTGCEMSQPSPGSPLSTASSTGAAAGNSNRAFQASHLMDSPEGEDDKNFWISSNGSEILTPIASEDSDSSSTALSRAPATRAPATRAPATCAPATRAPAFSIIRLKKPKTGPYGSATCRES